MKKTVINVPFDEEKLSAAKMYMAQKELSFEEEMEKAAESLYGKYVPSTVREFIELRSDTVKPARSKKARPSSVVGNLSTPDGDSD